MTENDTMLTEREAATMLGLRPNTLAIWRHTHRYELPYHKYSKSRGAPVRYAKSDIVAFLQAGAVNPRPAGAVATAPVATSSNGKKSRVIRRMARV